MVGLTVSLKTGSLDNAIQEFSLAQPSWIMSHYTMRVHEDEVNRKCFCKLSHSVCSYKVKLGRFMYHSVSSYKIKLGRFVQIYLALFWGVFNQTIIPLAFVGYEMKMASSALLASSAIHRLISNERSWNKCLIS